ncbi:YggS family pyridoxal phosphate-dependent enzyme [Candidatus Pelagibacter sp.]|nr:YggS family pyridoxal phosphate-dependent enzyme [Candidatus Pelagibacter sp.]
MHNIIDNLKSIDNELKIIIKDNKLPTIIAVSKTFDSSIILPLLDYGHKHFGENKVQEAVEKWTDIKDNFNDVKLHMIGKLQTNKVKFVIPLFDYIHSLDSIKLAKKISEEQVKKNKKPKIFIQVNIGNEDQKSGINPAELKDFYQLCVGDLDLDIIGLMCLPPKDNNSSEYFIEMRKLAENIKTINLSMGMSNDYSKAAENGATFLRIGSKIFGKRD